jgi:T5orf172 domain
MPHPCQYCGSIFNRLPDLTRHQETAKYCFDLRPTGAEKQPRKVYKCNCGSEFSQKGGLKRHQKSCDISAHNITNDISTTTIISEPIVEVKDNIEDVDQLFKHISPKIGQLLNVEIMEKGIQQMISHIIHLFEINGNWAIRVIDASRNKFTLLENGVEIIDNKGEKIARLIRHQFIKIVIPALDEAYKSNNKNRIINLEILASDLRDDDKCYCQIVKGLIRFLSNHFESSSSADLENSLKDLGNLLDRNRGNNSLLLDGFIYVIREREFMNLGQNVFKIGKTNRPVGERLCEYPKGSYPHYFENVKNCDEIEQLIIKKLKSIPDEFIHRKDIGSEYFEGCISKLIFIIKTISLSVT